MKEFTRQGDEQGCGLACLRMALIHYSGNRNYAYLTMEGRAPYSLDALQAQARQEGLVLTAYRLDDPLELANNLEWPILAVTKTADGGQHMVYLASHRRSRFLVLDPSRGANWIEDGDFLPLFSGVFLQKEEYGKTHCRYKKPQTASQLSLAVCALVEVLAAVCLAIGFYFMGREGNFILPLVFFTVYAILEVMHKYYLICLLRRFDGQFLPLTYESDPKRFRENYSRYHAYKKDVFGAPSTLATSFIAIAALTFLLYFNCVYSIMAIAALFLALLGESLWLHPRLAARKEQLTINENDLFSGKNGRDQTFASLAEVGKRTYRIIGLLSYRECVYVGFVLVLSLLLSLASETISLNFLLFHGFCLYYLGEQFGHLLAIREETGARESDEIFFLERILAKRR